MNFVDAMLALMNGKRVTHTDLSSGGEFVRMFKDLGHHVVMITTPDRTFVPWVPTQRDISREDWKLFADGQ